VGENFLHTNPAIFMESTMMRLRAIPSKLQDWYVKSFHPRSREN
jgi:hypothetical protein